MASFLRLGVYLMLLGIAALVEALPYTKSSGVISLTKKNFEKEVYGSEHVWLVEFYAPCGHCKNLAPEYEKLAKNMQGIIKVAAVNGDEERELAGEFGIQGFPTIKLFHKLQKKGGKLIKVPEDYNGPRTAAALAQAALAKLPNFVIPVTSAKLDSFLENPLPKVLLFTDKKETTNLYKALSVDFHNALALGQVRDTEKEVVEKYNVDKFPTLIVLPKEGDPVTYDGQLKHEALHTFLKGFAGEVPPPSSEGAQEEKKAAPPKPQRPVREEVTTQKVFDEHCEQIAGNCFIALLDKENATPEEHEGYLALLEKTQAKYQNLFTFVWLDGLKQTDFIETFHLHSGFPAGLVYNPKKKSVINYVGSFSESSLFDFLDRVSRGSKRAASVSKLPKVIEGDKPKDEL